MSERDLIQAAIAQAEKACQAAVESTPPAYHGFIIFISQNKRVGGTRQSPVFASVRSPYMGVDGRVKMAQDEHREKGATLSIETEFSIEPTSGQLVCRAVVTSSVLGMVTAHARAFLNGTGADATNPLENGESSAIGRALGFLGYGLYGMGIASAEEVLNAIKSDETAESAESPPVPNMAAPIPQEQRDQPPPQIEKQKDVQTSHLKYFWAKMRPILQSSGMTDDDLKTYMGETYGIESTKDLTPAQLEELLAWGRGLPGIQEDGEVVRQRQNLANLIRTRKVNGKTPDVTWIADCIRGTAQIDVPEGDPNPLSYITTLDQLSRVKKAIVSLGTGTVTTKES